MNIVHIDPVAYVSNDKPVAYPLINLIAVARTSAIIVGGDKIKDKDD